MFLTKEGSYNTTNPIYLNIQTKFTLNELGLRDFSALSLFVPEKEKSRYIFEKKLLEKELILFCEEKIAKADKAAAQAYKRKAMEREKIARTPRAKAKVDATLKAERDKEIKASKIRAKKVNKKGGLTWQELKTGKTQRTRRAK